jgi:hypothetical protein
MEWRRTVLADQRVLIVMIIWSEEPLAFHVFSGRMRSVVTILVVKIVIVSRWNVAAIVPFPDPARSLNDLFS